jgi:hypothetical protein
MNITNFISIYSVRILLLTLTFWISGCLTPKKIQVQVKPLERTPLQLPAIAPLQLDGMHWYVVTESNFAETMNKLRADGSRPVIFALDEAGYENLGVNMAKIRSYMAQQKVVIAALKDYYNVPDNTDPLSPGSGSAAGSLPPAGASSGTATHVTRSAVPAEVKQQVNATDKPVKKGLARFIPPFINRLASSQK